MLRILTTAYILFVLAAVAAADNGALPGWVSQLRNVHEDADKILHFLIVGGLALTVNLGLPRSRRRLRRGLSVGTLVVLVLATAEECTQLAFATRTFDLLDMTANCLGALLLGHLGCCIGDYFDVTRRCSRSI